MSVASTQDSSWGPAPGRRAVPPGCRAAGPGARHRAVEPFGGDRAVRGQVHEPHALAVACLGEGVRQRGAGVADALGDGLAAVEVAERHVVDAVEDAGGDGGDAADGDVPLAVAGFAAGDEGVGEDDGPGAGRAGREVGPDPVHGGGEHGLVAGLVDTELAPDQGGFQVGQAVEGDVAVGVPRSTGVPHSAGAVRRWMPARPMRPAPTPRRRAESWLPEIITVGTPRPASRCRASSNSSTAASGGTARSYTSPETTTASTACSRTLATRWSMKAAWASSMFTRWKARPRCQSDVCSSLMIPRD